MLWVLIGMYYVKKGNFKQAAKFLYKGRNALKKPREIGVLAEALYHAGESERALAYLHEMIPQHADSSYLYERRANILFELSREEEAIADLDVAIGLDDSYSMSWYTRGLAYNELGKFEEAIRDLKEAIKRERQDTVISTYYQLAETYFRSGQYEEAVVYFQKTLDPAKATPAYYYMLSRALDECGRTKEAIDVLFKGMPMLEYYESRPDKGYAYMAQTTNYSYSAFKQFQSLLAPTYSFWYTLFELYLKMNEYKQAEEMIGRAISLYPDELELVLCRGDFYLNGGQLEQALADYEHVLERDPMHLRGHYQKAMVYRQWDEEDQALQVLEELHHMHGTPMTCYWLADSYYRLGRAEEGLQVNKQLLELENDDPLNYMQQGELLLELDQLEESARAFGEAARLDGGSDARNRKSFVLYLQGKYEESIMELQESEKLDEAVVQDPNHHMAMGHNYKAMGQWGFAAEEYAKAIARNPEQTAYWRNRAECHLEMEQYEAAAADYSEALAIDPEDASLYQLRGYAYYYLQEYDLAKKDVLQGIQIEPTAIGYYNLGRINYAEYAYEEALTEFQRTVELDPTHASSYLFQAYIYYDRYDWEECVECLVRWALHSYAEMPLAEVRRGIEELEGFDEDVLARAVDRMNGIYGEAAYLS